MFFDRSVSKKRRSNIAAMIAIAVVTALASAPTVLSAFRPEMVPPAVSVPVALNAASTPASPG